MSIASELNNLEGNIEDSYDAVNDMGGIIPAQRNMDNLDQAIRTIPQSQGTTYTAGNGIDITNDVISIDDTVVAELSDIPTVNNATLTIQHNGTTVNTFTANASTNKTANVETIYADPITSTSALTPPVQTNMIADGAITPAKLSDTGWVLADQYVNTTYFSPREHIYYRILGGVVYWRGQIYCHTAPSSSDHTAFLLSGLPNNVMPASETSATGQQFMIANGIYNLWTENNGIRVWEASQQIPATNYWEGYDLTRLHYISSDY